VFAPRRCFLAARFPPRKAVSFSSACTTKRFPSLRSAHGRFQRVVNGAKQKAATRWSVTA